MNAKKWMVRVAMAAICVLPGWVGDARAQGSAPARRAAAAPPSVPRQIEARQRQWLQAIVARDVAAAGLLLAADLTFVNDNGAILTRTEVLDRMKENRLTLDAIETKEVTVKPYGTAALWQGKVTFVRQGNSLAEARVTALWVRRAGTWRLATLTAVPMASSGQSVANFLLGSREMITDSGLKYEDLVEGTGESPRPGQTVVVHYTGTLENGKKFDSSLDRGRPFEFAIGQGRVIKGWDEGVMSMKVGGKRRLIIPPALGYGNRDLGVIPPNSTLIFEVELLELR